MTILSAIVLAKNEADNLAKCLQSLSFCDEIILIDDYSTDNTSAIAKKMGALVYKRALNCDFSAQRAFGETKASGDWILHIDADEIVTKELAIELTQCINDPVLNYGGFYLRRIDTLWGRKMSHAEFSETLLLRLFRKNSGIWKRSVHEVYHTEEKTYRLQNPIMHFPHQTLTEFIAHVDQQSTLHAQENHKENKRSSLIKIIIWPIGKFLINYILKGGFKDGTEGFVAAAMMSFHSWLSWSKLWLLQKRQQ